MQDNPTATVTITAACELGSHRCKGVVLSLTGESWDAQTPCACGCHEPAPVDPEQELEDRYKVSRNTIRLALGMLANEGMITSTPGRGTFVRERVMLTYHATRAEAADRAFLDCATFRAFKG